MDWSTKAPWSEMILIQDGLLHMIDCSTCSAIKGHPVIMGSKWDTVRDHGLKICHAKNTKLFAQRCPTSIWTKFKVAQLWNLKRR
jgi:hypothetical protein